MAFKTFDEMKADKRRYEKAFRVFGVDHTFKEFTNEGGYISYIIPPVPVENLCNLKWALRVLRLDTSLRGVTAGNILKAVSNLQMDFRYKKEENGASASCCIYQIEELPKTLRDAVVIEPDHPCHGCLFYIAGTPLVFNEVFSQLPEPDMEATEAPLKLATTLAPALINASEKTSHWLGDFKNDRVQTGFHTAQASEVEKILENIQFTRISIKDCFSDVIFLNVVDSSGDDDGSNHKSTTTTALIKITMSLEDDSSFKDISFEAPALFPSAYLFPRPPTVFHEISIEYGENSAITLSPSELPNPGDVLTLKCSKEKKNKEDDESDEKKRQRLE